jgi:hypothetical protein
MKRTKLLQVTAPTSDLARKSGGRGRAHITNFITSGCQDALSEILDELEATVSSMSVTRNDGQTGELFIGPKEYELYKQPLTKQAESASL